MAVEKWLKLHNRQAVYWIPTKECKKLDDIPSDILRQCWQLPCSSRLISASISMLECFLRFPAVLFSVTIPCCAHGHNHPTGPRGSRWGEGGSKRREKHLQRGRGAGWLPLDLWIGMLPIMQHKQFLSVTKKPSNSNKLVTNISTTSSSPQ